MSNREIITQMPTQVAAGMYRVGVVDGKTHEVKYMSPWRKNLILNSGLNAVATNTWMSCIRYCYAGTGSAANYTDSGTDTASSDASGAVTSIGSTIDFTTFTVGDSILWDSGAQGRIVGIGTPNTCAISTEYASPSGIASGEFTVLKTSRTSMTGTVKFKNTSYLTGIPNQLASQVHNATSSTVTNRQTYDFNAVAPADSPPVTINEIGVSWQNVTPPASPLLFSRIVIPGGITLQDGDYLRVVYQLTITISPTDAQVSSMAIDNAGTPETWTGSSKLYNLGLSIINVGNASVGTSNETAYDSYSNEPSVVGSYGGTYLIWVSYIQGVHNGVFPNYGAGTYWTDYISPTLVQTTTRNLYALGLTYSQEKYGTWAIGQANANSIKAMGFGKYEIITFAITHYPYIHAGIINIFDSAHWKLNTQTLTLRIKYSWSRTLSID